MRLPPKTEGHNCGIRSLSIQVFTSKFKCVGELLVRVFASLSHRKYQNTSYFPSETTSRKLKDKEISSAVLGKQPTHMDTNLPNPSFCIYLWLWKLLAEGFHSGKPRRIASHRRHFEISNIREPAIILHTTTWRRMIYLSLMITNFYHQNANENIRQFVYHFQDRLPFFPRIDHCDLCERAWFIVRLNVKKISADIAWFSKRNLQRARLRVSAEREHDSEQNTLCRGTVGWFGICHWYWCK